MRKQEVLDWLSSLPRFIDHINGMIYVRSVLRSDGKQNIVYENLFYDLPSWMWCHITYCVKPEEEAAFKARYPNIRRYIYQPPYEPTRTKCGCGEARYAVFEDAVRNGFTTIMLLDDDVKAIEAAFEDIDRKGCACSHHTTKVDHATDPKLTAKLLNASMFIADHAMRAHGVFGLSLRRQHFSGGADVALTAYNVNAGSHPRQFMFWNMRNVALSDIRKLVPIDVAWHGEDIVCGAICVANKLPLAMIQFLMFDFLSEQASSSIRDTDENSEYNRALHKYDGDVLAKLGLTRFTKVTKTYEDGSAIYRTLDWSGVDGMPKKVVSLEEVLA